MVARTGGGDERSDAGAACPRLRRDPVAWLLFVLAWFSLGWFGSWEFNPNNSTRMFAAISLAEHGDARIDRFANLTIDKATFDGHAYTDKAPGMTLLATPIVAAANQISGERSDVLTPSWYDWPFNRFLKIRTRLAAVFVSALLSALATALLYDLVARIAGRTSAGVYAATAFAFGTTIWGWSTTVFGHAPVAALLVMALWATWRGTGGARPSVPLAAVAGLALGWAVLIEHAAVITGLPVALLALYRLRAGGAAERRAMLVALAAGSTALAALVGYNLLAFGTPFRVGYSGVTDFQGMQEGLFGLTYPKPYVLWQLIFGERRGMLWVAPILIAAPFGLWRLSRQGTEQRALSLALIAGAVLPFLLNASYFYWDGGNATGPRHALPAIGFLAVGLGVQWAATRDQAGRTLMLALLAGSIVLNLVIASAEIAAPDSVVRAVYEAVYVARFQPGYLRTVADEWLGFTPWQGLAIWAAAAGPMAVLLVGFAWRRRDAYGPARID